MKTRRFKSKLAYRKYGHMRIKKGLLVRAKKGRVSMFKRAPGYQKVYIAGQR